jgi:hypothetical protein
MGSAPGLGEGKRHGGEPMRLGAVASTEYPLGEPYRES